MGAIGGFALNAELSIVRDQRARDDEALLADPAVRRASQRIETAVDETSARDRPIRLLAAIGVPTVGVIAYRAFKSGLAESAGVFVRSCCVTNRSLARRLTD